MLEKEKVIFSQKIIHKKIIFASLSVIIFNISNKTIIFQMATIIGCQICCNSLNHHFTNIDHKNFIPFRLNNFVLKYTQKGVNVI